MTRQITQAHWDELMDKRTFCGKLSQAFQGNHRRYTTIEAIEYDVLATENDLFEFVVVTYRGGAIAAVETSASSLTAIFQAVAKVVNGGYYDEVAKYEKIKAASKDIALQII